MLRKAFEGQDACVLERNGTAIYSDLASGLFAEREDAAMRAKEYSMIRTLVAAWGADAQGVCSLLIPALEDVSAWNVVFSLNRVRSADPGFGGCEWSTAIGGEEVIRES